MFCLLECINPMYRVPICRWEIKWTDLLCIVYLEAYLLLALLQENMAKRRRGKVIKKSKKQVL